MHSFLGLITLENCWLLPRAAPPSGIVSGLSQSGEVRQPRDWETSYREHEHSSYVKAKGRGSIITFFCSPSSPSLRAPLWLCLSSVVPPLKNLTRHWLNSHLPRAKQGEVKEGTGGTPTWKISFVSLMTYGPKVFLFSLSHGGLQILKLGRVVPNTTVNCWWECRLVQPLWKTVWNFLRKLKMELPFDSVIPLLGLYPKNPEDILWGKKISIQILPQFFNWGNFDLFEFFFFFFFLQLSCMSSYIYVF